MTQANKMDNLEEVKLFRLPAERDRFDNMADAYSLINTIQCLEKAYIREAVDSKDYTAACSKLLAQFKTAFKQIDKEFGSPEHFLKKYRFECRAALERIQEDRPITIKDDKGNIHACISEIVSGLITIGDRVKVQQRSMDELYPEMKDLHEAMLRLTILPPTYEGISRIKTWVDKMSVMSAVDEITEAESRQLLYDLETSLFELNKILLNK